MIYSLHRQSINNWRDREHEQGIIFIEDRKRVSVTWKGEWGIFRRYQWVSEFGNEQEILVVSWSLLVSEVFSVQSEPFDFFPESPSPPPHRDRLSRLVRGRMWRRIPGVIESYRPPGRQSPRTLRIPRDNRVWRGVRGPESEGYWLRLGLVTTGSPVSFRWGVRLLRTVVPSYPRRLPTLWRCRTEVQTETGVTLCPFRWHRDPRRSLQYWWLSWLNDSESRRVDPNEGGGEDGTQGKYFWNPV